MSNKIKKLGMLGLIAATGAILGVAATAILIVGLVIEYKTYSVPGWPRKKITKSGKPEVASGSLVKHI